MAVANFFRIVTQSHSFSTGGSNDHEFWGPAQQIGDSILKVQQLYIGLFLTKYINIISRLTAWGLAVYELQVVFRHPAC